MSKLDSLPTQEKMIESAKRTFEQHIIRIKNSRFQIKAIHEICARLNPDLEKLHGADMSTAYFYIDDCQEAWEMLSKVDGYGFTVDPREVYLSNGEMVAHVRYGQEKPVFVLNGKEESERDVLPSMSYRIIFFFTGKGNCTVEYEDETITVKRAKIIC